MEFLKYSFSDLKVIGVVTGGDFNPNSTVEVEKGLESKLLDGKCKLVIQNMGNGGLPLMSIQVSDFVGSIRILAGSDGSIKVGRCGQINLDIRIGHGGKLNIEEGLTCNQATIVAVNSFIEIGKDCMFSDGILLQGCDQHGIIDLATGEIINSKNKILINDHVWVGRRSTIMPGVCIDKGSIVGACSTVTKDIPKLSLAVGVPAKVVKQNVTWCRPFNKIDPKTKDFIAALSYEW